MSNSSSPADKPIGKMTKEELVVLATELTSKVEDLQTQLDYVSGATNTPGKSKLSMEIAEQIRKEAAAGASKNSLSLKYRVSRDTISSVVAFRIYKPVDPAALAAKEKALAEKEAAKAKRAEDRAKAKAEKEAAKEAAKAQRAKASAEKTASKAAVKAKATPKTKKAPAEAPETGPVRSAKKPRPTKAPAEVATKTPEQKKAEAAEMRKQAYERAQKRVAAQQAGTK